MNLEVASAWSFGLTAHTATAGLAVGCVVLLLGMAAVGAEPTPGNAPPGPARAHGLLVVANKGDRTLSIVAAAAGRQLAAVPEDGVTGHEVAISPDGKQAFVPIYGDSGVGRPGSDGRLLRVIDLATHQIVDTLDFGKGIRPHCAVFGPRNGLLYVTTELDESVTVIDPRTLKIIGRIPTGQPESHMLAITRDGRRGYTSNVGPGTVSVLDLEAKKVLAVIPVVPHAQRIALSVNDRLAFTADQTKPRLAVIDTATNGVRSWIPLPGIAYGTAPTPDGRWLLATIIKGNKAALVDLDSMQVTRTLDVPAVPQEVVVQSDGQAAYVSCDKSAQVAVLDLKDWKVSKLIDAGHGADGLAWTAHTAAIEHR